MIIIGEKLNSSIPRTFQAMQSKDEGYILNLIKSQDEAGSHYLDINTAICGQHELQTMEWVVKLALENSKCGIMLDSPSSEVILKTIPKIGDRKLILNSVSLNERLKALLPTVVETQCGIVALPIGDSGMPKNFDEKFANAKKLIEL